MHSVFVVTVCSYKCRDIATEPSRRVSIAPVHIMQTQVCNSLNQNNFIHNYKIQPLSYHQITLKVTICYNYLCLSS